MADPDRVYSNEEILEEICFYAKGAIHPFYVVQISQTEERELHDKLVSDALVELIQANNYTHIIAQTHGWNTPPDKAVAVPFTEFIGGMQNDQAMPRDDEEFRPLFVAFIWNAVPIQAVRETDARTRAQLMATSERDEGDNDVADVLDKAVAKGDAGEEDDSDDEDFKEKMLTVAKESGDVNPEETVRSVRSRAYEDRKLEEEQEEKEKEEEEEKKKRGGGGGWFGRLITTILKPVEFLVFGRLRSRGRRTGAVMGQVLGKLMAAAGDSRPKVCLMANSLGAHVLCGVVEQDTPYKIHTVFFIQGAIAADEFSDKGELAAFHERVAGPVVCTHSDHDTMLSNIFSPFYGSPLGYVGVTQGLKMKMKSLDECCDQPYRFNRSCWHSVDGTRFIDEGNAVAGGHGDFKEDETTSLYWAAIKTDLDDDCYEW